MRMSMSLLRGEHFSYICIPILTYTYTYLCNRYHNDVTVTYPFSLTKKGYVRGSFPTLLCIHVYISIGDRLRQHTHTHIHTIYIHTGVYAHKLFASPAFPSLRSTLIKRPSVTQHPTCQHPSRGEPLLEYNIYQTYIL